MVQWAAGAEALAAGAAAAVATSTEVGCAEPGCTA